MKLNSILSLLAVCTGLVSQAAHAVTCLPNRLPSNPDTAYTLPVPDNGTVTHAPTGLTWKRCSEGQNWSGGTCTGDYTWYTWAGALAAGSSSSFAGHTDWRLPNIKELRSLVEECRYQPAINDTIFPGTPDEIFWSSSPKIRSDFLNNFSWYVSGSNGVNADSIRAMNMAVRLVRGGDYFDNKNLNSAAGSTALLSVSSSGNGSVSTDAGGVSCTSTAGNLSGVCSAKLPINSKVTLTATPIVGGYFIGWSGGWSGGCSEKDSVCTVSMSAAKVMAANFSGGAPVAATVPGAPTGLTASAGDASANLVFTAPGSNGGALITAYLASCTATGQALTGSAPASPVAVASMRNGTSYSCTVRARNSAGEGTPSVPVEVTPVASTAPPGAVTSLIATAGDTRASLVFAAPSSGGSVASYSASCTASGAKTLTGTATSSPIDITGMINGTTYSCAVLAMNSFGNGPESLISVTPAAPLPSTGCYPLSNIVESSSAEAHTGKVTVTTGGVNTKSEPCPGWGVKSDDPSWITVDTIAVVSGSLTNWIINYTVDAYSGTSLRTGTLSIGDAPNTRIYTINQYGPGGLPVPICTLTASPSSIAGGNSSTLTASCDLPVTSYAWTGGTCVGTTGASCTVTPAANTTNPYTVVGTNATGQSLAASASVTVGDPVINIIDHFYTSILNRTTDADGKAFWQSEVARMSTLGVSASEAYIALARSFFASPEFVARGFSDDQFVQNLYLTFFNRAVDQGGLDYWKSELNSGLPRDMVMYAFMFSPEFRSFMTQNVGANTQRAEIGAVVDYYRGAFVRLPDDAGLKYWVNQFRSAQCASNPTLSVYDTASSIAGGFFGSAEYLTGSPTASKRVSDLYNTFMRRGADLAGFNYWVRQLSTNAQTYDQVRKAFIDSAEFAQRAQAIAGQGCANLLQ